MLIDELKAYHGESEALKLEYQEYAKKINDEYRVLLGRKASEIRILEGKIQDTAKKMDAWEQRLYQRIKYDLSMKTYSSVPETLKKFQINPIVCEESLTQEALCAEIKKLSEQHKEMVCVKREQLLDQNNKMLAKQQELLKENQEEHDKKHDEKRKALLQKYEESLSQCVANYTAFSTPSDAEDLPKNLLIGSSLIQNNASLKEISAADFLKVPFNIDVVKHGNIIVQVDSATTDSFNDIVENTMVGLLMNYLEAFPSGQAKVGIFSSYFSSMPKLGAFFSAIKKGGLSITSDPCTNQQKFSALLNDVENHCNMISAKMLENCCADLHDLYEKNIRTEPFQLVLVHNVLRDLTEENIRTFCGCITGMQRCGLRIIIVDDFSEEIFKSKSAMFKNTLMQIKESCQSFILTENGFVDEHDNAIDLIKLENDTTMQSVYDFCTEYCSHTAKNKLSFVPYEKIGFGKETANHNDYESIIIPVGLNDPDTWQIELNCVGRSPIANLVIGIPGTGKSTLIDSMIMNGAMKYSPDEVVFQLLDFKDGISSSVYTMEDCKIPHIKVVSQNNKPEEAEIILSNILAESERRNKEFQRLEHEIGVTVRNIAEYNRFVSENARGRKNMPRLIIVIDECQYLFEEEGLAKKCEDIVRKCRSQGIHLILATQTMSHKMWNTIKFVDGRYCFEIAKDDAEQLLNRKYAATIATDVPKGSYMAYASNNSGQDCEKIRIAYDGGKTDQYAKKIRDKWHDYPIDIVTIGDKDELNLTEEAFEKLVLPGNEFLVPLGENYVDHSTVYANCENGRPLLVVGTNVTAADHIFTSVVKTAAQKHAEIYVTDASRTQALCSLCRRIGMPKIHESDENGYLDMLLTLHDIYESRKGNIREHHAPVVFVVHSLQNINAFLNNTKLSKEESAPAAVAPDANMSFADFLAAKRNQPEKKEQSILGKESLFNLISNAYRANIFICLSMDSASIYSDSGEPVFSYQHRNILKMSDYKLLVENVSSDVKNIMEDSFKEKMMANFGPNMAFMSEKQQSFSKFRYFRHL